ncbi:hypothetical protein QK290_08770 [Pseudarthrobacter sp. AL07]|uniref:hypothetical protein n=1 Tax=Pseudarthrobacter sp. AL07 TaxID=3042233 RepID=UPI00249AAD16|nr:hypothetical protein [Pseudarthrobacter sp. AL07]MDI3208597.1 hypothetical protein [Pseudarthrobacter sp. AL07]
MTPCANWQLIRSDSRFGGFCCPFARLPAAVSPGRLAPRGQIRRDELRGSHDFAGHGGWVQISVFTAIICGISAISALTAKATFNVPTRQLGLK